MRKAVSSNNGLSVFGTTSTCPRSNASSRRGPVYTGNCVVRLADSRPWQLKIDTVSPGLKVELRDKSKGGVQVVQITWRPASGTGSGTIEKSVQIRAKTGEESETITIPVTCAYQ